MRLKKHFALDEQDDEGLRKALEVDFRSVVTPFIGEKKHQDDPARGIVADMWGIRRKKVAHESGYYWDYCDFPLKDATVEQVAQWPMPAADDFDYSNVTQYCDEFEDYALVIGHPGWACIINTAGFFRGMTQVFMDLALEEPACLLLIDRFLDVQYGRMQRTLEASNGKIDIVWFGEDLGTQDSPLISMDMLQKLILPRHKRFFDLAKSYDLKIMMHNCGSSSWAFDEYIKLGLDVVDTLQPEAVNTSPEYLKKNFGGRLTFHGCISTAGPVAYGTVQDTIDYCKNTLDIMMPGGGYCFAPTHELQDNTPTENAVAMYETAREYGKY
jgi:uroporphyrinogen decarboxylase